MQAYHVQPASGLVKLDAMENPYGWPGPLLDGWVQIVRTAPFNRYPDPEASSLKAVLRQAFGIPDAMSLMLGNGSDEIIQILLMALAGTQATVLAPEPTFVMYRQIATSLGLRFVATALRADNFALHMPSVREQIAREQPQVIFLSYPNNPTGNLFATEDIDEILHIAPGLVVIDEAYAPFTEASYMPRLGQPPHLLVMRTLSKMGFAGLRLGFLAGPPMWLEQFEKLRLPYNINILTQLSVEYALAHAPVFQQQTHAIVAERAKLFAALSGLAELHAYPSDANFILCRLRRHDAGLIFSGLKRHGLLVKNLHTPGSLLENCLRLTVGTPAENDLLLRALAELFSSRS